ncbi:MAG: hypothetical protein AAGG44_04725 [Planctomycetota bacterium]
MPDSIAENLSASRSSSLFDDPFANRGCWILVGFLAMLVSVGCEPTPPPPASNASVDQAADILGPAGQAVAGVGKEGQSLRDDTGVAKMISGPISALANFKQKAVLEIQVKQAIDVFKAMEGRFPKDHDEFMKRCIEANRITLPELPDGYVYQFNSEKGQLWYYPEGEVPN